jgi:hypothetical protein
MTDARKVAFRQIAEASLAADALVPVNTNYATTAFATHTFTVACRSWYLLGSGRGGRSQGLDLSAATYCRSQSTKNQDARATK